MQLERGGKPKRGAQSSVSKKKRLGRGLGCLHIYELKGERCRKGGSKVITRASSRK